MGCLLSPAMRAEAAEDCAVLADRDARLRFEIGKHRAPDDAAQRDKRVAGGAVQMIVMRLFQFEAGATIVKQHFDDGTFRRQLLGGAEHRGKIRGLPSFDKARLQALKGPCVVFAGLQESKQRCRYASFSRHPLNLAERRKLRKSLSQSACKMLRGAVNDI